MAQSKRELEETARAAFACYDRDGNGSIDTKELRQLIKDLGGQLLDEDLAKALRVLDRDNNGSIEQEEFLSWWTAQDQDLDGDGVESELEIALGRLKELGRQRFHVDIHTAAWSGFGDVVSRLLEDDDEREVVNAKDSTEYGNLNTALHYAAYQGHLEVSEILLSRGASVNAVNSSGCTPLFFAAQQSRSQVVDLLLQKGADLKLQEAEHRFTAVDVCTDENILAQFRSLSGSSPATPLPPILSQATDQEVSLSWNPPKATLNELAPISGYKIKLIASNSPTPKIVLVVPNPTEIVIDELDPGTEYVGQIAAINLHGMSEYSAVSSPILTLRAKPSRPNSLKCTNVSSTSVTLEWEIDPDEGSTACILQQSFGANDVWTTAEKCDASTTSTELRELLSDQKYLFRLASVNESGRGAFTKALSVRTLESTAAERKPKTKKLGWSTAKAFASDFKRDTERKSSESVEQPEEIEACKEESDSLAETSPNNDESALESKDEVADHQERKGLERKLRAKRTVDEDEFIYCSDSADERAETT